MLVTARHRGCGKIIFSYVSVRQSVILSKGEGSPCDHCSWYIRPHCTGPLPPPHEHQTWDPPLRVLTSGGDWNTYGCQAGGTHPTRMLSCFFVIVIHLITIFEKYNFPTGNWVVLMSGYSEIDDYSVSQRLYIYQSESFSTYSRSIANSNLIR